ncbi:MAG: Hsp70 family protein [Verrucomicrobiota bacterium]
MNRTTIDYGIDLGTTNSAIALATGVGTEIIKNNFDADTTASAVYINKAGNLWVGQGARSKLADERAGHDVHLEFKRRMGTAHEHHFRSSGRRLKPEELSAEILKSLRADVAQKKGEDITAAVLTVPAAFGLHQCDATRRAAALAGFTTAPLLQEPIAAALAYGFQKHDARAYWLVFDFGGGTFDAALVRSEHGVMSVVNHDGDNFLGGTDIDWAIVENILVPRVQAQFKAPDFARGNERHRHDLLRLKAAAELAKIDLSRQPSSYIELDLFSLGSDRRVLEVELTRGDLAGIAEPSVLQAVAIARRVLASQGLEPSAVEKLVFVGGPTLAPYFRDLVAAELGIPCDLAVDPLTVVARGAAIFASAQRIDAATLRRRPASAGACDLDLVYKPVGADPEPIVGGKVHAPANTGLDGAAIEFVNTLTKWRSGRLPLAADGTFQLALRAEIGQPNPFVIELSDAAGTLRETRPAGLTYTIGLVVEEQTLIHNLGVALADNQVALHFPKGAGLPAKSTRTYRTTSALQRDTPGSLLRIPVIEGDHELADRNLLIGTLDITAGQVHRDMPLGTEVEVTFHMDASRLLSVIAYVPLLDEEFPARLDLGGAQRHPDLAVLREEFAKENKRLADLRKALGPDAEFDHMRPLIQFEKLAQRTRLITILKSPDPDFDSLLQAEHILLDLKNRLDTLAARLGWPLSVQSAEARLMEVADLIVRHGTPAEQARAAELQSAVRTVIDRRERARLPDVMTELNALHDAIRHRQPEFWREHFEALVACRELMTDPAKADQLITAGRAALADGRHSDVTEISYQLQDLIPPEAFADARHGYGSSLLA